VLAWPLMEIAVLIIVSISIAQRARHHRDVMLQAQIWENRPEAGS